METHKKQTFFLCIGAQKSGTTWLHRSLLTHPNVGLPPIKELHFFDEIESKKTLMARLTSGHWLDYNWRLLFRNALWNWLIGVDRKKNLWIIKFLLLERKAESIIKYKELLHNLGDYNVIGEITPAYQTISSELVGSIKKEFPNLKVIFILRNPVEREWAQARMNFVDRSAIELDNNTSKQIGRFLKTKNKRSEYLETINNWSKHYPPDQFLICFYEELKADQLGFINKILDFLCLEKFEKLPLSKKINVGASIRLPDEYRHLLCNKYYQSVCDLENNIKNRDKSPISKWKLEIEKTLSESRANARTPC